MSKPIINGIDVSYAELYEKNVQLQKENKELKDRCEDYLKQLLNTV